MSQGSICRKAATMLTMELNVEPTVAQRWLSIYSQIRAQGCLLFPNGESTSEKTKIIRSSPNRLFLLLLTR